MNTEPLLIKSHMLEAYGMSMDAICEASKTADMTTLTPERILGTHKLGYFGVLATMAEDGVHNLLGPWSYTGYTKDRIVDGKLYAQVGGLIRLPEVAGLGFAARGIEKVITHPLPEEYSGWSAVINEHSERLFKAAGFVQVGLVPSEESGAMKPLLVLENGQSAPHGVE